MKIAQTCIWLNVFTTNGNLCRKTPDDDKFVDCAILADVDYLVTNDLHFKMAKKNPFPAINIINADDFLEIMEKL